jgi:hypothetical protein
VLPNNQDEGADETVNNATESNGRLGNTSNTVKQLITMYTRQHVITYTQPQRIASLHSSLQCLVLKNASAV